MSGLFTPEFARLSPAEAEETLRARRPLRSFLRTFWLLAKFGMRERMHYRTSFAITTVLRAAMAVLDFFIVAVILLRFRFVDGWDMYEVAVLYGLASLGNMLYKIPGNEMEEMEKYMVSGEFDSFLVRPWPTLFGLLARRLDFGRVGIGVQGLAIALAGIGNVTARGQLTGWELAYLPIIPLCGAAIIFAVSLATAAVGFWMIRTDELQVFTIFAPLTASFYPLSIYPGWLKRMLYTVIPMAFANYLPVSFLLGKGGGPWALFVSPLVAGLAVWLAYRLWTFGEGHYQSTGS